MGKCACRKSPKAADIPFSHLIKSVGYEPSDPELGVFRQAQRGAYALTISHSKRSGERAVPSKCASTVYLRARDMPSIPQRALCHLISESYKRHADHFSTYSPKFFFRSGKSVQTTPYFLTNLSRLSTSNPGECPFSHLLPINPLTQKNLYEQGIQLEIYCIIRLLHCLRINTFVSETAETTCIKKRSWGSREGVEGLSNFRHRKQQKSGSSLRP
jgi:hypothetical protein